MDAGGMEAGVIGDPGTDDGGGMLGEAACAVTEAMGWWEGDGTSLVAWGRFDSSFTMVDGPLDVAVTGAAFNFARGR